LVDDVERRGISGTGAPTTITKDAMSSKKLIRCQLPITHVQQILSEEPFEFVILPAEMGLASNDVGPTPSKDGPCTFTAPFDLAAEDLVLDV
jgi:hypothetical protein